MRGKRTSRHPEVDEAAIATIADKATIANETDEADKADEADEADEADKATIATIADEADKATMTTEADEAAGDDPDRPLSVLVVDDEPSVVMLIIHTLSRCGYLVDSARSGAEALGKIDRNGPDILVTDIHMPEMTGMELMRAALRTRPDLLSIAITGYGDVETAVAFMKSGGFDYLQKPVNRDVLVWSVTSAAERYRMRDALRRANAALAARNRELEWEMARARELYDLVLEPALPRMAGASVNIQCLPARRIGGDVLDLLPLSKDRMLIFLADVTGHGVPAAMTANTLKTLFREVSATESEPTAICRHLNRAIHRFILPDDVISVFCGLLDLSARTLDYYLSGLPPPLICRNGETISLAPTGLPLGFFADPPMAGRRVAALAGDLLVATTDGITEAMAPDGRLFGKERLRRIVAGPQPDRHAVADAVVAAAAAFTGRPPRRPFRDDVIALALRLLDDAPVKPGDSPACDRFLGPENQRFCIQTRHIHLDAAIAFIMGRIEAAIADHMAAVGAPAGQAVGGTADQAMEKAADPAMLESLRLAFMELFTNAVEHGSLEMTPLKLDPVVFESPRYEEIFRERMSRPPHADRWVHVACRHENGCVILAVSDEGPGFSPDALPDPADAGRLAASSGRGIAIARMNVDSLNYDQGGRRATMIKRLNGL